MVSTPPTPRRTPRPSSRSQVRSRLFPGASRIRTLGPPPENDYLTATGLAGEKNATLFPTLGGRGRKQLTGDRMTRQDARRMIVRRARKAGLPTRVGCHSFRATGITVYLLNGGLRHNAPRT